MPKFAANLSMLFTEVPFLKRFESAANSGFDYIEYLFPYEWDASTLATLLKQHQLKQVLFNLPPGDWSAGERGIACLPDRKEEFKRGVDLALAYADTLGVSQLNCLAGLTPNITATGNKLTEYSRHWDTLHENIAYAASQLEQHHITLMLEPINSKVDMPGFFLDTLGKTKLLIKSLNLPNIKIQFDIYHMQIMQGDILRSIQENLELIGHIQFADCPGRHEPGTGELNFDRIFQVLDQINYSGWVSAEYIPQQNSQNSLSWFKTP